MAEHAEAAPTGQRRVGLFGGSFDPVHHAHLALAQVALHTLALDELRFVPTGHAWQKAREQSPAHHRVAMLERALQGQPRLSIDTTELQRPGPSYSIDTVVALAAREPGTRWWLLIGQDQHANFHTWHRWRKLLGLVRLAVAARPGATGVAAVPAAVNAEVLQHGFDALPLPPMTVSATQVRATVAAGGDISQLVPPEVARYIDQQGLYRPRNRS